MDKQKHLEIIQGVINRMANCSFLLKGWSITLIAAIFGLAAKDANIMYVIISYIVIPFFWMLDGYYLSKERQYRELYKKVRKQKENEIDFDMSVEEYDTGKNTWLCSVFAIVNNLLYIPLIIVILIVMFVLK